MNVRRALETRLARALQAAGAPPESPALVLPAGRPEFGDYQANGCMAAAKQLKTNPHELAKKVLEADDLSDLAAKAEIAGPGFINIHLKADWIARQLAANAADEHLGVARGDGQQTVVVDYSSPNLAKEMHAGHLRSTIIGDAICRTLEFLGQHVIRQNHVGDFGTLGAVLAYLDKRKASGEDQTGSSLADLEEHYRKATQLAGSDETFAQTAREYIVRLQQHDPKCLALREQFVSESLRHCQAGYERLGITLCGEDTRGEFAYVQELPDIVRALDQAGLLAVSEGAQGVFLDEFKNKEGEPGFVIIQKSDGGYLYATTDLAAMRYRCTALHADRILYVTDSRQSLHFRQVFAVAKKAGFVPESVSLEHVGFGMMMGSDNRPFKTREGGTVKLTDLLDEGEQRAFDLVSEKNPDLDGSRRREIARVVGIGAVKYADLSQNRTSDYVFSFDKMLSLDGNTAPYMQYAYARIQSIFRKGQADVPADGSITLTEPAERALGVKLVQFPEVVATVAAECLPNLLCGYLFELAGAFMGFYENCPVLKAATDTLRSSRLALCHLTAQTIHQGLDLLGIETIEQM